MGTIVGAQAYGLGTANPRRGSLLFLGNRLLTRYREEGMRSVRGLVLRTARSGDYSIPVRLGGILFGLWQISREVTRRTLNS